MAVQSVSDIIDVILGIRKIRYDQALGLLIIDAHPVGVLRASLVLDGIEMQVAQFAFDVHPFGGREDDKILHSSLKCDSVVFVAEERYAVGRRYGFDCSCSLLAYNLGL